MFPGNPYYTGTMDPYNYQYNWNSQTGYPNTWNTQSTWTGNTGLTQFSVSHRIPFVVIKCTMLSPVDAKK